LGKLLERSLRSDFKLTMKETMMTTMEIMMTMMESSE